MATGKQAVVIVVNVLAFLVGLSCAATYTVGPNGRWNTGTDYNTWASTITFVVGDNLDFEYGPNHDVAEVDKTDYDSCQATNPIGSYTGGSTTISLTSPGKRYFICTTAGHCNQGMKLEVDTVAATTPSPPPASAPPPESNATTPSPPVSPSPNSPPSTPASPPPPAVAESPKSPANKDVHYSVVATLGWCIGLVAFLAF